jgi:phage-related protein
MRGAKVTKPVVWMGSARRDLQAFPSDARRAAGRQLNQVQLGRTPADFKPISTVGSGVYEIRIHTQTEHRLIYVAKFAEAVYVLHAFEKRTRKTNRRDLEIAQRRLAEVLRSRG